MLSDAAIDILVISVVALIALWWCGHKPKAWKVLRTILWTIFWGLPPRRKSKWFALGLLTLELGAIGVLVGLISVPFFIGYSVVIGFGARWRRNYRKAIAIKPLFEGDE